MRHLLFSDAPRASYPICFLVPTIKGDEILKHYFTPYRLNPQDALVLDLHYDRTKKKTSMAEMKRYISEELVPLLTDMEVQYIVVADAEYFKALTKAVKVEANLGYVMECEFGAPGQFKVVYVPNYRSIFYDPEKVTAKIAQGIEALMSYRAGTYEAPGNSIIKFESYPQTDADIWNTLQTLLEMNVDLSADIEAFGLKHYEAGIGTVSIAWSKHEGIAFPVDYVPIPGATEAPFGMQVRNERRREMLRLFFEELAYRGRKLIWHSISYDTYVLIYQLYLKDILDTEGLLQGLDVLLPKGQWHCTKLISYLATNSCAGNQLALKSQAQEFAGNYAMGEEIKDITRIPLDRLLRYNLVDALSTWHVFDKHWPTLVDDQQQDIYEGVFQPAIRDIVQMQLTGMPVNMERVKEVKAILEADEQIALATIRSSPLVERFTHQLREIHVAKRNEALKKKQITLEDEECSKVVFNPNSSPQLQSLLYEMLGLPVIAYTDSKQPSTKAKVLGDLKNHTTNADILTLLDGLCDYAAVAILLETFIPALENAQLGPDGWHYLFGNFNLGGTLSGRLSSSEPNLQNIPTGAEGEKTKKGQYGKLIKSCFEAPPGWIFAGLDFASLEDRISALTTKDPNKLKVYTDGYDGHSMRAFAYFGEHMPDIDGNSVESINSIADNKQYKPFRQKSKAPTFALTYQGTYSTLMTNCGFTQELAMTIEARYHELYKVSDDWVAAKLDLACKTGFITAAFGLRVRTPLLHQVIRGTKKTPYEAEAEGRSAGNALGQSWCLLNSRAASEFMDVVRASEHRLNIKPCAQIHDAQYYLLRDDVCVVGFTNKHLVKAVQWQDHPDIAHDDVKLGGELSIFWPNWSNEIGIANELLVDEIPSVMMKAVDKYYASISRTKE